MLSCFIHLVGFLLITVASANPIARQNKNQAKLPKLREKYPGIYWDTAAEECSEQNFDIIAESVRVASDEVLGRLVDYAKREESTSFNRFFVRVKEEGTTRGWASTHDSTMAFLNQRNAFDQMIRHIRIGGRKDRTGVPVRRKQIKYKCNAFPGLACGTGTAGKTHEPGVDEGQGWSTVFCPLFFSKTYQYINELGNKDALDVSDLPNQHAREHVVIHELAHADVATGRGGADHIEDITADLPGYRPGGKVGRCTAPKGHISSLGSTHAASLPLLTF